MVGVSRVSGAVWWVARYNGQQWDTVLFRAIWCGWCEMLFEVPKRRERNPSALRVYLRARNKNLTINSIPFGRKGDTTDVHGCNKSGKEAVI